MKMSFKITRKILILKTQNTKMIWGNGMTNNFGEGSKSKKKKSALLAKHPSFYIVSFFSFYENIPAKPDYSTFDKYCKLDMF